MAQFVEQTLPPWETPASPQVRVCVEVSAYVATSDN